MQPNLFVSLSTQARSHKGEIIQFMMTNDESLQLGLNLAYNLRDLGYDHWFIFGGFDANLCNQIKEVMPDAGLFKSS